MRSLATLGGVLVLIVLAIAWKISNQVEAGQEPDNNKGRVTLGVSEGAGENSPNRPAGGDATQPSQPELPAGDNPETSGNDPELSAPSGNEALGNPTGEQADPSTPPANEPPVQPEPTIDPTPPAEEEIAGIRYTVKEGDTLYRILMNAYGKANDALIDSVAVASDLDDPGQLRPGMELVLPVIPGYDPPKRP